MNKEQIEGKLMQIKADIKKTWSKLTDDDIMLFESHEEKFYGKLKEKYGIAREESEAHIKAFQKSAADMLNAQNPEKYGN